MLGAIADGDTHVTGFLDGEDCLSTARALGALGVRIERPEPTEVLVHGVGAHGLRAPSAPLDMGNAGTAMRLFTGLQAPQQFRATSLADSDSSTNFLEDWTGASAMQELFQLLQPGTQDL